MAGNSNLSKEEIEEMFKKAKKQTFVCLICGKENKGIVPCDHKKSVSIEDTMRGRNKFP